MATSIYSDFPLSAHETRIIRLQPGKWPDAIHCDIEVVSLSTEPEFEALSYTWGEDQAPPKLIKLNNLDFCIKTNLDSALRHLRNATETRVLWVDAICINQSNKQERNEQVGIMRDIYSLCKRVLIWLDTADGPRLQEPEEISPCQWLTDFSTWPESCVVHLDDARKIAEFQAEIDCYYTLPLALRHSWTIDHVKGAYCLVSLLAQNKHVRSEEIPLLNNHDAFHRIIVALSDIMKRPWWTRQWVIQEIVLAPEVALHHGHFDAPWELFSHAARNYEYHRKNCCQNHYKYLHGNDIRCVEHFYRTIVELDDLRDKWQTKSSKSDLTADINLRELLWQFRSRDAKDPLDKVFALFPLVNDWGEQEVMDANYNLSPKELYRDVVEKSLAVDKSLLILMGSTGKVLSGLPSWVPDWTTKPPDLEHERLERTELFSASNGIKLQARFHGQDVLELVGIQFDVIATVSEVMSYDNEDKTLVIFKSWYSLLHDDSNPVTFKYPNGESRVEAYWGTLCMDSVRSLSLNGPSSNKNRRYHRCSGDYVQEARRQWMSHMGLPLQKTKFTGEPAPTMPGKARSRSWHMESISQTPSSPEIPKDRDAEEKLTYVAVDFAVTSATMGRRLFFTRGGFIGLGPKDVKVGDDAYVFAGAHMPLIVRQGEARDIPSIGRRECHQLVGECYIHGIMDGEAMGSFEQAKCPVFLI